MAGWEPTAEDLVNFKTLESVVNWTKMPMEVSAPFLGLVGATGQEHPCVLGMMEHEEIQEVIKDLKIGDKNLNIIQRGHIRTIVHVCRLVAGTETPTIVQKEMEDRLSQVVSDVTKVAEETKALASG